MKQVAKFEKVSYKQFKEGMEKVINEELLKHDSSTSFPTEISTDDAIKNIYDNIKLPHRATKGSAGYDFYLPTDLKLSPKETVKIPTGIRVEIDEGWVLKIYPRSSLGFKYRLQLDNTVGIIDSDYYYSDNEGHIFAKITNDSSSKTLILSAGDAFMQGIFCEYGITKDDDTDGIRNGGIGSTNAK